MKITQNPELKKLVTFIQNKKEPIHNWYYYKEGYSKPLVEIFLDKWKPELVLDPFLGVGTTCLTCKEHGIKSVGFDISPLAVFVSKVKVENYNKEKLKEEIDKINKLKPRGEIPKDKWLKKMFSPFVLEKITGYRNEIMKVEDEKIRNFLMLGLMDAAMQTSYVYKQGAVVIRKKQAKPPFKKYLKYKLKKMYKTCSEEGLVPSLSIADARKLPLDDSSVDCVITSPPYLNKIEYTKIYKAEYALFFGKLPPEKFIEGDVEESYFEDMKKVLNELYRVCKKGAKLAIVIGGGCFSDHVTMVDKRLAEISEDVGFTLDEIQVARNSWCTKQRTIKVGQMRESVVLLTK